MIRALVLSIGVLLTVGTAWGQMDSVVTSPHNLSALGPGNVRATGEQEVCVFCHTPHNATPVQPLWNREISTASYQVYASNSLKAKPGQPTGASKLCLSCHDGTIALGSVGSRGQLITMANGVTTLPPGHTNLGTDLRDDHPISFKYDATLRTKNAKLADPAQLPEKVRLDSNQELQCTTCHDAHDNSKGKFLVMDNSSSQLCKSCHVMGTTNVEHHDQCASCHQPHTAPSGPYLLKAAKITDTCLQCHNGGQNPPQGPNLASTLTLPSKHDTGASVDEVGVYPNNSSCADCHEPHTMKTGTAVAPAIKPNFGEISGATAAGGIIAAASNEYEVCYKCHGSQNAAQPTIARQVVQTNLGLKFDPQAASFHPVQARGRNNNVPSLKAGFSVTSIIYCTDCHSSDLGHKAGGSGADGPHGSNNQPLLIARYETLDNTTESDSSYALCYRCHERNNILANASFPLHSKHIVDHNAPCAACHDAHGIDSAQGTSVKNSHLINFNTQIVSREPVSNRLEFNDLGQMSGQCYLTCHGTNHTVPAPGEILPAGTIDSRYPNEGSKSRLRFAPMGRPVKASIPKRGK